MHGCVTAMALLFLATIEPSWTSVREDGHALVRFTGPLTEGGELRVTFDFGPGKGFLGPSDNPTTQAGFANSDRTLFAVNHQPVTKSSYVHLLLRSEQGDLTFLNQVNLRAARLLPGRWADAAKNFLRVESVSGRQLTLRTTDFMGGERSEHEFWVAVSPEGELSLLDTTQNHKPGKEK